MALKEVREDLQKPDSKYAQREHDKTVYDAWHKIDEKRAGNSLWQRAKDAFADKRLRLIFISALSVASAAIVGLVVIVVVQFQRSYFTPDKVAVIMQAPQSIVSNRPTAVSFTVNNDNRAALRDVEVHVSFGQYFVPDDNLENFTPSGIGSGVVRLSEIDSKSSEKITVTGVFIAPENEIENMTARVSYTPHRRDDRYTVESTASTTVTSSPLIVSILSEKQVVSGNIIEFLVQYENASEETIEDVSLEMTYPPGFSFLDATPQGESGFTTWSLGTLSAKESGEIRIRGAARGNVNNVENISGALYVGSGSERVKYSDGAHVYRIVSAPIVLTQKTIGDRDGVLTPGESIDYQITFKNTSEIALRDVVLRVLIDGEAPDYGALALTRGGFFDAAKKEIIWRASEVPELAVLKPGDTGRVEFTILTQGHLPVSVPGDKNFTITTIASIDSNDVPSAIRENKNILSNAHIIKLAAKPLQEIEVAHVLGPVPPRVGLPTTYRVTLRAGSVNNDLRNVVFEGSVPSGIAFAPLGDDVDSAVVINERTNTFNWNIGSIRSGTGVVTDLQEESFNIILTPSVNDINRLAELVRETTLRGTDAFTERTFEIRSVKKTTQDAAGGNFSRAAVAP